jgi:hypothetical protein
MMIRGRHRDLPYAPDRAITLPSDKNDRDMERSRSLKRGGEKGKTSKGIGKEGWRGRGGRC